MVPSRTLTVTVIVNDSNSNRNLLSPGRAANVMFLSRLKWVFRRGLSDGKVVSEGNLGGLNAGTRGPRVAELRYEASISADPG